MTDHPCKGMTPAQREEFERIAINEQPHGRKGALLALKERGLIVEAPPKLVGKDRFGEMWIPQWQVPIHVHYQWCTWCSEQPELAELI